MLSKLASYFGLIEEESLRVRPSEKKKNLTRGGKSESVQTDKDFLKLSKSATTVGG